MNTIKCPHCGNEIELSQALTKDIEASVLEEIGNKHRKELEEVKKQAEEKAILTATEKSSLQLQQLELASEEERKANKELRDQILSMSSEIRTSKKAVENAEIEMHKKLNEEEAKIREEAQKDASEAQRLKIAEKDKQLEAAKKQVEEMQRKLNQGSQQMQGEILELDLEEALAAEFKDDDISPVEKGIKGADIKQTVRSPRGTECGVILWEIKRTKAWTEGWVQKLKDDLRGAKANIPVIITEVMPKDIKSDIHLHNGVWVVKPGSALILASLLRKGLLDVGREKAIAKNRDTSADALYGFVTSHEFSQQIEAMVEVYTEMIMDVIKEKAAFDKIWAKRENQAKKLLGSTANIIGSMQGQLGAGASLRIKGLELLESGDDAR